MNPPPMIDPSPLVLKACGALGLFVLVDEVDAGDLRDFLTEDEFEFSFNPSAAEPFAQPGKAILGFGRQHPRVVAEALELCGMDVVIDPDVIIPEDLYQPPVKQLLARGEPRGETKLDYTALGLSQDEVPALIRMATDGQLHGGPQDSPVVWAPVHAWRALAQLRAEEAIAPLMELFRRCDDDMDEWVGEDLPRALARFGAVALAPLAAHLADPAHGDWSRVAAAKSISRMGGEHPGTRADCVRHLGAQLGHFAEQSETLNAFLVSPLLDLRAVEAMPVIERAFASGRVDESVVGDVEDVQIEFGLKRQREHPRKPNKLTMLGERLREQWPLPVADDDFTELEAEPPGLSLPHLSPPQIGRNDPCPCGSGKKHKKCCGM